jgi:hypothetical protein
VITDSKVGRRLQTVGYFRGGRQKLGKTSTTHGHSENEKAPETGFSSSGAGFEPATSGLCDLRFRRDHKSANPLIALCVGRRSRARMPRVGRGEPPRPSDGPEPSLSAYGDVGESLAPCANLPCGLRRDKHELSRADGHFLAIDHHPTGTSDDRVDILHRVAEVIVRHTRAARWKLDLEDTERLDAKCVSESPFLPGRAFFRCIAIVNAMASPLAR